MQKQNEEVLSDLRPSRFKVLPNVSGLASDACSYELASRLEKSDGHSLYILRLVELVASLVYNIQAAALASPWKHIPRLTRLTTSRNKLLHTRQQFFTSKSRHQAHDTERPARVGTLLNNLLHEHRPHQRPSEAAPPPRSQPVVASFTPEVHKYLPRDLETPSLRWTERKRVKPVRYRPWATDTIEEIQFRSQHHSNLSPRTPELFSEYISPDYVKRLTMRSFVQVLTTPTADTPGTTLFLHFDNKRYLIGSLAEGTQRACVQMGARLLKTSECFLTGRTEWSNTGGLIGMILTLADSSASSSAASVEENIKRVRAKAAREGYEDDVEKMRRLEADARSVADNTLNIFGPPNLNHTLATARRFVFRKGMPLNVHEFRDDCLPSEETTPDDKWAPMWADGNIKVWAMSISPSSHEPSPKRGKKRSIDEVYAGEKHPTAVVDADLTPQDRDYLTVKAVVAEMFNSSWRLDTLHETPLSEVKLPATMFIRNANTNKVEKYTGPLPGDNPPPPTNIKVLVRKPWPGALVETLPSTQPAKEAISYIFRNHTQRGKFNAQRAAELKVPKGPSYSALTKGESVMNEDGETITPDMVLGASRVGGGIAVIDLPTVEYIDNLISRPEWREPKVMEGVGAVFWICGKDVATDSRLHSFMQEMKHLEHIVSSPDYCPNYIALDSVAASTVRLKEVDPDRYGVPVHDASDGATTFGGNNTFMEARKKHPLPDKVHTAARGQVVTLEPAIKFEAKDAIPDLKIAEAVAEMPQDVMEEARKAQEAITTPSEEVKAWISSLPPGAQDAEVITLGTGSALPSKYRNVSATLVRVPGWGNILLDCGENTLGQLRRVYTAAELKKVLQDLKIIVISHMHADHQLGTTAVVKAWYAEVHNSQPAAPPSTSNDIPDWPSVFENQDRLAIISEPAMQNWLAEYSSVEDYGYSRLAPLSLTPVNAQKGWKSRLSWFIPPTQGRYLPQREYNERLNAHVIPNSLLNLADIQAVAVKHCHGARAVSITLPSGFKVSYSGDCRPSHAFSQIGKGSTVCIHEATFDDELQGDAEAKNHSTTSEALRVAQNMGAKACVLTHFSQRYQKVPVLERADDEVKDAPMADAVVDFPQDEGVDENAPLEDVTAATFPAQPETEGSAGKQYDLPPRKAATAAEAVKFKLNSDMKVCVAFDYMRVKVGDIAVMEKFTPALLKLFAEEEKEEIAVSTSNMEKTEKTEKMEKTPKKGKDKKKGGKAGK